MSQRDKLIEKMQKSPGSVRFSEVEAILRHFGFIEFNAKGSHRSYHSPDGRLLTIVKPHGGRRTCHAKDIKRLLEFLSS
jgi:predicted RNA binding protein YcfA (HicA-like mRNA interferase family)